MVSTERVLISIGVPLTRDQARTDMIVYVRCDTDHTRYSDRSHMTVRFYDRERLKEKAKKAKEKAKLLKRREGAWP